MYYMCIYIYMCRCYLCVLLYCQIVCIYNIRCPQAETCQRKCWELQKKRFPDECLCSWVVHMGRGVKIWCCSTKRYSFQVKLTKTSMDYGYMGLRHVQS